MCVVCVESVTQTRNLPSSTGESLPHKALPRHRPHRQLDSVVLSLLTNLQDYVSLSCPRIKMRQNVCCVCVCVCVCKSNTQTKKKHNHTDLIRESTTTLSMLFCNKIWVCGHDVVSRSHNLDIQSSLLLGAAQGNNAKRRCDT